MLEAIERGVPLLAETPEPRLVPDAVDGEMTVAERVDVMFVADEEEMKEEGDGGVARANPDGPMNVVAAQTTTANGQMSLPKQSVPGPEEGMWDSAHIKRYNVYYSLAQIADWIASLEEQLGSEWIAAEPDATSIDVNVDEVNDLEKALEKHLQA